MGEEGPGQRLTGLAAAPGLAQGRISLLGAAAPAPRTPGDPQQERAALLSAVGRARREAERQAAGLPSPAADMLGFQAAMLADDALVQPALAAIEAGVGALPAWEAAMAAEAAGYDAGGAMLAARTADLQDICDRVRAHLAPGPHDATPPGAVLAGADLTLSRFLRVDWSRGGAIVLTGGSPAGHVAMLARAQGVPMVVATGGTAQAWAGRWALVDGAAGQVLLDPSPAERAAFAARAEKPAQAQPTHAPAITRDGTPITLTVTLWSLAELDGLDPASADGVGLVRTELLFHGSGGPPSEEGQYEAYRRILRWAGPRPVVIRAFDAGGDKPMPGLAPEAGPSMGVRGIRLLLQRPDVFRTHLRALARAAAHGDVRVLLPLVTVPDELEAARALLHAVMRDLAREGTPARQPPLGIMVEVPAAALAVSAFGADFFAIGANDLTGYVTAAGRDIASVAHLADPLNPAVLALVAQVARHGREMGRDVGLCGDAASDPRCIGPMLHAGVRSFSAPPNALARVRAAIEATELREP